MYAYAGAQVTPLRTVAAPRNSQRLRAALDKAGWFGVFFRGLSELFVVYNHDSFESESLKGA